jgi:hypothetical protein
MVKDIKEKKKKAFDGNESIVSEKEKEKEIKIEWFGPLRPKDEDDKKNLIFDEEEKENKEEDLSQ